MAFSNPRILFGELLRSVITPALHEFGASDQKRVEAILGISNSEKIRLSDCLTAAFPELDEVKALKSFTNFRSRFNQTIEEKKVELSFVVDSRKRDLPANRFCWFLGADPSAAQVAKYSEEVTGDIKSDKLVAARGIVTTGSALESNKRVVRFFVSYSHENSTLAKKFEEELRTQFKASKRYELELWIDRDILVGKKWHNEIQRAIKECDFGLFLVSPAFLGSEYIKDNELPHFVGEGKKPVFPVGLIRVSFGNHDLKGLDEHQIFLKEQRFYEDMRSADAKRNFVHAFYLKAEERLTQWFEGTPKKARRSKKSEPELSEREDLAKHLPIPEETCNYQPTRGFATTLAGLVTLDGKHPGLDQARDALKELEAWATNSDAPPFFALLGEYGIGKTTTLKQFTRQILDKRSGGPDGRAPQRKSASNSDGPVIHAKEELPLPIYIDLRDYVVDRKEYVPTIEELLDEVIRRSWKLTERTIAAKDILRLVREEGALIIFDGLDEKIVHLPPDKARAFIRTLWAVLPDVTRRKKGEPVQPGVRRGKMILSCRSHYFRDAMSQNSMLVGEDREGLDTKSYPALCLLPFTEEQIRGYLKSFLGNQERATAAFDLIARIHNLPELAKRPYLLTLITSKLEELENFSVRGETVNAARLYDLFVQSWLNRDDGKHQLDPAHKRQMMEDLAAAMWRSEAKVWDAYRLERWLEEFLVADENRALAASYVGKDRNVLKEDLRTATFVLRPDTQEKEFRFAHTSLQEFFLASFLARALREGKGERWDLPMPSLETLEFFGQILQWGNPAAELQTLNAILGDDCVRASTIGFEYWLLALEKNLPAPAPAHVNLAGADLEEWTIRGLSSTQPLNLRGANLSRVKLNRSRLENVDLTGADMTGLEARQSLFLNVQAARMKATGVDFAGLQWRGGTLAGSDLSNARLACQLIDVNLTETKLPQDWSRAASAVDLHHPRPKLPGSLMQSTNGHSSSVNTVSGSPDSQRLVSGSDDQTLKVWDAASGACLLTLKGHEDGVLSCGWSPDGQRLVSGSSDQTLKVWDAASGACLLTLKGHENGVNSCGWSPDGQRLVSGSYDQTLKVWDAASGACLLTLKGHEGGVNSCGWSPDGQRLVSGSSDKTLKVWDAASGACLLTLKGHENRVRSCGWSPDGQRLVSGSYDQTLKVWDAASGACLLTLKGHENRVWSCGWSPDGQRLVSGSSDQTLKVWDAASGACLLTLTGHEKAVRSCGWSPDGQRLVSGSDDQTLKVWDAASGACLLTLPGHEDWVWSCGWSPDGQRLVSGSDDQTLKVWDAASGACLLTLKGHENLVMSCGWSPDGQRLVSGSSDKTLKVWDAASGACLLTLKGHENWVMSCGWSPDGQRLVSGSSDQTLKVWDAASGACLLTLPGHENRVLACGWSPDGQRLVSGSSDQTLKVWDAASGACLLTLTGHEGGVLACGWSADGQRLVSGSSDKTLKVWDAASGACLLTLPGHEDWVWSCGWSPDGQRLLSGSDDQTLKVWDAASGACLLTLKGHENLVMSCGWSPDGQRLVSGSRDGTMKVWDAANGVCLWTAHHFPELQTASIDRANNRLLHASPEAWRFLGWRWFDPELGQLRLLPAETFGPLPG